MSSLAKSGGAVLAIAPAKETINEVSVSYLTHMARVVKAKPDEQAATGSDDMKKTRWATAEYKHIILGLISLKYISTTASPAAALERKLLDKNADYYLGDDDPELLAVEMKASTRSYSPIGHCQPAGPSYRVAT